MEGKAEDKKFSDLINLPPTFFKKIRLKERKIREASKRDLRQLPLAHTHSVGALASAFDRNIGRPMNPISITQKQFSLVAHFLSAIDLVESLIVEGFYFQAGALIRQEMETIATIEEIKEDKPSGKNTANIKILGHSKILYGRLSKFTHMRELVSNDQVCKSEYVAKGVFHTPAYPTYRKDLCRLLYSQHVFWIEQLGFRFNCILNEAFGEGLNEIEDDAISQSYIILDNEVGFNLT